VWLNNLVHRRSPEKLLERQQRHDLHKFIVTVSYHDLKLDETVNLVTPTLQMSFLQEKYKEGVSQHLITFDSGEVLTDSRGRGSMQQVSPPKTPRLGGDN